MGHYATRNELKRLTIGGGSGSVTVRKNSGADVGSQPRINLIEGSNVTLTIADDGGSSEIDVTIAASGGGGTGNSYFPGGWG